MEKEAKANSRHCAKANSRRCFLGENCLPGSLFELGWRSPGPKFKSPRAAKIARAALCPNLNPNLLTQYALACRQELPVCMTVAIVSSVLSRVTPSLSSLGPCCPHLSPFLSSSSAAHLPSLIPLAMSFSENTVLVLTYTTS